MKFIADTNVLLRAILDDHPQQSPVAQAALSEAEIVAISPTTLCELVWVLRQRYKRPRSEAVAILKALVGAPNVAIERQAVETGIALEESGGDFADAVVAFGGRQLGGETFLTFDKRAARLLPTVGVRTRLLD